MTTTVAPLHTLNGWDYAIIAFYFGLVVCLGLICRRLNKNPSDYFRGGGNMLWWIGAVSAIAASMSTWTFTGGAAKCYEDGLLYPFTVILTVIPSLFVLWYFGPKFRRLRVITAMEGVFRRFGFGTEQFYTWVTLPMGIFWGAVGMNTLGVFMGSVLHLDVTLSIVGLGLLVVFLAVLGGQWALSFFSIIQATIILLVTLLVAFLSVNRPEIGGLGKVLSVLPERHLNFGAESNWLLVWLWMGWQIFSSVIVCFDMRHTSGKFIRVKDDGAARKMVFMMLLPFLFVPLIIQLPSFCAAVVYPNIGEIFPNLKKPAEGAWLAMAMTVLPQGLMGLMVCAIFGAAADSADAALNANAGFFVRNVYIRVINPAASQERQVLVGKIVSIIFGGVTIALALMVNSLRTLNLFDLMMLLNAMLIMPMMVPMALGILIKNTPGWSGWSSVIAGFVSAAAAKALYSEKLVTTLLGLGRQLSERENNDARFLFISIVTTAVSALWFLATSLFWKNCTQEHRQRVDALFSDLARPVDHLAEGGENQDAMQYRIVGLLSLIMGGFLLLCIAIPNGLWGRMAFLVIGGILCSMGLGFRKMHKRQLRKDQELQQSGKEAQLAAQD